MCCFFTKHFLSCLKSPFWEKYKCLFMWPIFYYTILYTNYKLVKVYLCVTDASTSSNSTPTCTGMVVEYQPLSGLILNTHFSPKSRVPLSEMAEPGVDLDLGRFKEGLVVNCRYVKRLRHGGVLLTLREERWGFWYSNTVLYNYFITYGMIYTEYFVYRLSEHLYS